MPLIGSIGSCECDLSGAIDRIHRELLIGSIESYGCDMSKAGDATHRELLTRDLPSDIVESYWCDLSRAIGAITQISIRLKCTKGVSRGLLMFLNRFTDRFLARLNPRRGRRLVVT